MSEHAPTTEEIRTHYAFGVSPDLSSMHRDRADFDRWLAAHDAQVLREAAEALPGRTPVRHRVNGWLRERADRIEAAQG